MTKEALLQERGWGRNNNNKKNCRNPEIEYPSLSSVSCPTICPSISAAKISRSVPASFNLQPSQSPLLFILSAVRVLFCTSFSQVVCQQLSLRPSVCSTNRARGHFYLHLFLSELTDKASLAEVVQFIWVIFFLVIIVTVSKQQPWEFVTLALLWATAAVQAIQLCRTSSKQEGSLHT